MISREQCLEWAKECYPYQWPLDPPFLEALINRAYAEGLEDAANLCAMLPRSAFACECVSVIRRHKESK